MSSISAFWLKKILRNLSSTSVAAANLEACYNILCYNIFNDYKSVSFSEWDSEIIAGEI